MEEIYASAKGKGTKDRLRILIDLDAARTSSIGELAGLLDSHGITLTLRGGSVTFIDRPPAANSEALASAKRTRSTRSARGSWTAGACCT